MDCIKEWKKKREREEHSYAKLAMNKYLSIINWECEDGGQIGGSRVHFLSMPVKYLADLRSRANSQQYSSI